MKQTLCILAACFSIAALNLTLSTACAQNTAFTYQGQLQNNGSPASGTYDFQFSLYTTNANGTAIAGPFLDNGVTVTNGLFTVIIDFGSSVWNGQSNWLQIAVETNSAGSFSNLSPRQIVTPTPYAIYAESANAAQLTGTLNLTTPEITSGGNILLYSSVVAQEGFFAGFFAGNPANDTGHDDAGSGFFALSANTSGADNTAMGALSLRDNLSGDDNTAVGEAALNSNKSGDGNTGTGQGVLFNNMTGSGNTANGESALVSNVSGNNNTAVGFNALSSLGGGPKAGGSNNIALGYLAGSAFNANESSNIDIGNPGSQGENNIIRIGMPGIQTNADIAGTIYGDGGGLTNLNATQLTGTLNLATPEITSGGNILFYSSIGAGQDFFTGPLAGNSANNTGLDDTASGSFALSANTTGSHNTAMGAFSLRDNLSGGDNTAVGETALNSNTSGEDNTGTGQGVLFNNTTGSGNTANGESALGANVSGNNNTAVGFDALESLGQGTRAGGTNNIALGYLAGSAFNANESSNIDIGNPGSQGENNIIRIGTPGIQTTTYIAGVIIGNGSGLTNLNASQLASGVISTGVLPGFQGDDSTIGGGQQNTIDPSSDHAVIGGGLNGTISANDSQSTIGGGDGNAILNVANNAEYATIGGGENNTNSSNAGTIAGGQNNFTSGQFQSTVGGGFNNLASGNYGTVPGGFQNVAGGVASFAAGSRGQATNSGAFVWSDNSGTVFASTNSNSFNVRAAGGYRLYTSSSGAGGSGVYLGATDNSWTSVSDRNAKKNFKPVDYQAVLNKLASVPIEQWNYKWESDQAVPNLGPMAQDFKHAFYPGRDDKGISTLEFDGVELAAIQGLNQKLQEQSAENAALKQELNELKAEVKLLAQRTRN